MAEVSNSASDPLRQEILSYLTTHNVMTIASCDRNVPWAAAVFYANDEFDLYFFSNPKSRHGGNMTANRLVSAAIHEDYSDWRAIRGIQLEGRAERLRSPQAPGAVLGGVSREISVRKAVLSGRERPRHAQDKALWSAALPHRPTDALLH